MIRYGLLLLIFSLASFAQQSGTTVQEKLGYPASARLLIIHADDFGMSHSVNRAIEQALENGWVTSSSILVPCPWVPEVAHWAQAHPDADLGIHMALNSEWVNFRWGPVTSKDKVPSLLDSEGYLPLLEDQVVQRAKPAEAEMELHSQVDRARTLGIPLSHLDTHMGTLLDSPALTEVYRRVGQYYHLPIPLSRSTSNLQPPPVPSESLVDRVVQISPGVSDDQWFDAYKKILSGLPPGVSELIVHLAYDDEEMRGATANHPDWGAGWRQNDFDMVRSPEFRQFLKDQGFILVRWKDLARTLTSH